MTEAWAEMLVFCRTRENPHIVATQSSWARSCATFFSWKKCWPWPRETGLCRHNIGISTRSTKKTSVPPHASVIFKTSHPLILLYRSVIKKHTDNSGKKNISRAAVDLSGLRWSALRRTPTIFDGTLWLLFCYVLLPTINSPELLDNWWQTRTTKIGSFLITLRYGNLKQYRFVKMTEAWAETLFFVDCLLIPMSGRSLQGSWSSV